MTFLDENNAYLDCVNDEINIITANGKMICRLLMSVSQNEIERTKIGMVYLTTMIMKLQIILTEK